MGRVSTETSTEGYVRVRRAARCQSPSSSHAKCSHRGGIESLGAIGDERDNLSASRARMMEGMGGSARAALPSHLVLRPG